MIWYNFLIKILLFVENKLLKCVALDLHAIIMTFFLLTIWAEELKLDGPKYLKATLTIYLFSV